MKIFFGKERALINAEAVLLVCYYKARAGKFHAVREKRVRSDDDGKTRGGIGRGKSFLDPALLRQGREFLTWIKSQRLRR